MNSSESPSTQPENIRKQIESVVDTSSFTPEDWIYETLAVMESTVPAPSAPVAGQLEPECMITEAAAKWIVGSVATDHVSTSFRPNAPRKQRCVILASTGASEGLHDMAEIAHAESWHKAVKKALLALSAAKGGK